ncbi:hypothetical protein [Yinghuangia sp. YIM S10712]|uniref:hypothetical protein n=1 Tax=Yinghuangia sp. YIM S10712 TaxID=3436930 RepID=UPI003F530C83
MRTLADRNPGLGRRGIAKALDELVDAGYYERRTLRDPDTGRIHTEIWVYDTAQQATPPLPVPPGTGRPIGGNAGAFPHGKKNREKEPTLPAPAAAKSRTPQEWSPTPPQRRKAGGTLPAGLTVRQTQVAQAAQSFEGPPVQDVPQTPRLPQSSDALARAAALLNRVCRAEPKLAMSATDTLALAPLALPWLETGVSDLEIRALLTQGLPPVVHSSRALLANRLTRKLPAPRAQRGTPALAECPTCRDYLPRGRKTGDCRACSAAPPDPAPPKQLAASIADRVAALRALATLRQRQPVAVV